MKTQVVLTVEKIYGVDMVTSFCEYSEIPLDEMIQVMLFQMHTHADIARMEDKNQIVYTERDVLVMLQTLDNLNKIKK